MNSIAVNRELLQKNKFALGYTRSCRKYVMTTSNSFLKEMSKTGTTCDASFWKFISTYNEILTIFLCHNRGADKLEVPILKNFLVSIGLDCSGSRFKIEITSFLNHLKSKLTKNYEKSCGERKQISVACKVLLDSLNENDYSEADIPTVNIKMENMNIFNSLTDFWEKSNTSGWSDDLKVYGKIHFGNIQLWQLKKEYTSGKLDDRLQKVYDKAIFRIECNKYKRKNAKPDDILEFIMDLGLDISFILQVFLTSRGNIPFQKGKIYTCPQCKDINRNRKEFFEHLFHHAKVNECPYHDSIARFYKDYGKYSETTWLEEKQITTNAQRCGLCNANISYFKCKYLEHTSRGS